MKDVAARAGVSVSTVSRVLNDTKPVGDQVRERVLEAVDALDFRPNQHARWLAAGKSTVVGLVMPSVNDSDGAPFLHTCSMGLKQAGFDSVVGLTGGDKRTELELVESQIQSHVSGIIIVPTGPQAKVRALLAEAGIPVLYAVAADGAGGNHRIVFDEERAAVETVSRALAARRYERIAVLAGDPAEGSVKRRLSGCTRALTEAGREAEVRSTSGEIDAGYHAAIELLRGDGGAAPVRGGDGAPDLLVCLSDYLAISALRAAYDVGVAVPQELSITGLGETIYSHTCSRTLTTVRFDSRALGQRAADTMVRLVAGDKVPRHQAVGFEIVGGESCGLEGGTHPWPA